MHHKTLFINFMKCFYLFIKHLLTVNCFYERQALKIMR